jgi:hypothetical protein
MKAIRNKVQLIGNLGGATRVKDLRKWQNSGQFLYGDQ